MYAIYNTTLTGVRSEWENAMYIYLVALQVHKSIPCSYSCHCRPDMLFKLESL